MPVKYDEVTKSKKPDWLKIKLHNSDTFAQVSAVVKKHSLNTICDSGKCPNKSECWSRRTATFMINGEICTRACRFCATLSGRPLPLNIAEPTLVAESVSLMGLRHCVVTSVTRDDLEDGGAGHWAQTVRSIRNKNPETIIELLIPDLDGRADLIDIILESGPDIVGHNLETVRRITPLVRSRASYEVSLAVLKHISESGFAAKSGIMVGLAESKEEVLETMSDLIANGCSILTIGQYLRPTMAHVAVEEYVDPEVFAWYKDQAMRRGFAHVESGPLVRSSYMADRAAEEVREKRSSNGCLAK